MTFHKVKLIENSNLKLDEKIEILLIYANQKPATTIDLDNFNEFFLNEESYKTKDLKPIQNLLCKINLFHIIEPQEWAINEYMMPNGNIIQFPTNFQTLYISKNPEFTKRLLKASKIGDEKEIGRMYGFPETAIQAYLGERRPFIGKTHYNNPLDFFTGFVFSQKYFKEELESTSKRWHDTIKKLSPKMHQEIINLYKDIDYNHLDLYWRDEIKIYYNTT
jgi:hypothetical protein